MTGASNAEAAVTARHDGDELLLSDTVEDAASASPPAERDDTAFGDEGPSGRSFGWMLPALAILAVLAWFAGMLWLAAPALRTPLAPIELVQFIGALCVPPALVGILYLLGLRTSRAEARRWRSTARAMRAEAASLERVLGTLSTKLDANRRELAEQTTLLITAGDGAVERLQAVANGMGHEARSVETSATTLSSAARDATKSIEIILSSVPKAHEQLRDMRETIDAAGLGAGERASALEAQFVALAERGREADTIAGGAAQKLAAHLQRMEATSETTRNRLEEVTGHMSAAVEDILARTAQAVDEARRGIDAQGAAIRAMLDANQAALDRSGKDAADALAERVSAVEETLSRVSLRLGEEQGRSDALFAGLSEGIAQANADFADLHASGTERAQALAATISALTGSIGAMTEAMRTGDDTAHKVIGTAEELLTALDASAREIDETLPQALERLDARIGASRKVVADSKPELLALVTAAESTHDAIEAIADVVAKQRETLDKTSQQLLDTLDSGREKAQSLETIVDEAITTTQRFAEDAAPALVEALVRVRETAAAAAKQARETLGSVVPEAERALEDAGAGALRRAVDGAVKRQLTELAETTEAAVGAATLASERLAQQMLAIAETTASVESRIEDARAERERADSDSFARRVSLLIEALNSASIDITKSFSHEVSDSAWAAYLKGDRGVFTRRAVRLLDAGEARQIAALYDADEGFRDNVNRYIHDFEAMLRQILALRDGSPLGVTLLSSDMGKLYVALAQAIERLRT